MTSRLAETRLASTVTSRWISISIDAPGSSLMSAPRARIPTTRPAPPPAPPPCRSPSSRSDSGSFPSGGYSTDHGSRGCPARRFLGLSPSVAILANRPFRIFHRRFLRPRRIFDRAAQHHRITVGINHRGEVDQHFGAPLYVTAALRALDPSLDVGPGRNHDPVIDHIRKGSLRIHRVSVSSGLRRNRLLQR